MKIRVEKQIGSGTLSIETGFLAKQAAGSCLVQFGETVVLTAAATGPPRPGVTDFFPLTCDYRERTAAAGKFPGGFLKREGRPTIKETLTSRLMDRPIWPLFPHGFRDEVQIQAFVVASDRQNDADVLAMNGASAALGLSSLPFQGPIASVRLGRVEGAFVPFPTQDELEQSDLGGKGDERAFHATQPNRGDGSLERQRREADAAEAPFMASTSASFCRSLATTKAWICTSSRKPCGNSGRIGRSINREVSVSLIVGRPSRFKNPPGTLPAAAVRSR